MEHQFPTQYVELVGEYMLLKTNVHTATVDMLVLMWQWNAVTGQPAVVPEVNQRILKSEAPQRYLHSSVVSRQLPHSLE